MKSQIKLGVKVVKLPNAEVAEGELVIKVDQAVVGFSILKNGEIFTKPMDSGKFKFRIVPNPRNVTVNVFRLFELNPVVFINQTVLQSHSADVCEVNYAPNQNMALSK